MRGPFASYCESLTIIVEAAVGIAGGDLQLFVFSVEIYSKQEQVKRTVASVSRDVFLLEIRCSFGAHRPTCEMIIMLSMLSWLQAGMYTTQLNSTENYGRRCLTPLSPHRNYILS